MAAAAAIPTTPRVLVIGAGVSGLAAARELSNGGCNVTVLEASAEVSINLG